MEAYGDFEIVRVPPWLPKILQGVSKFHRVSMRFSMISMGIWNFDDISKTVRPSVFLTRFSILLPEASFRWGIAGKKNGGNRSSRFRFPFFRRYARHRWEIAGVCGIRENFQKTAEIKQISRIFS